jgi:hypothetical protein
MANLTKKNYLPRLQESKLAEYLEVFGAVEVHGARWCGKTWMSHTQSQSVIRLDNEADKEAVSNDVRLAFVGEKPHLIDEWQEVPQVWDGARRFVDDNSGEPGQLILTGSATLTKEQRQKIHHSGTGRIARLKMYPMSLFETGWMCPDAYVSLESLFEGDFEPARFETSASDVADWCCHGGWPANVARGTKAGLLGAQQYIRSILNTNVQDADKSPEIAQGLLKALAMNVNQAVTLKTLLKDMVGIQSAKTCTDETLATYLELFERFYLIEPVAGWTPPMRGKERVRVKPKRYFVDPSLPAALLNATPAKLLHDMQTLGLLFEGLVMRDLLVFMSTYDGLDNKVSYYRDDKGLEVAAILEHDGRWAAVEIKLSDTKVEEAAANLNKLKTKVSANISAQNDMPAFMAVIVGKGSSAYQRKDGIYVIPMALLAP